jgi:hypothetical protein
MSALGGEADIPRSRNDPRVEENRQPQIVSSHFIGVHTVLGAFVAGVLIGESPILTRYIDAQLRGLILAFFMPVFLGVACLSTDLTVLMRPDLLLLSIGLIAVASLGKFAGAFLGAEIGGLTEREAIAVGCGMNARGSTEIIVATIGLSLGALSQTLYTMIVTMAVITTMAMPPTLRWALSRVPLRASEKKRLEREQAEAKAFVPKLERLLLAVDESPNGKFTSYIAGLLAGKRGMPITVLLANGGGTGHKEPKEPARGGMVVENTVIEDTIKSAAESNMAKSEARAPVEVILRKTPRSRPKRPSPRRPRRATTCCSLARIRCRRQQAPSVPRSIVSLPLSKGRSRS